LKEITHHATKLKAQGFKALDPMAGKCLPSCQDRGLTSLQYTQNYGNKHNSMAAQ